MIRRVKRTCLVLGTLGLTVGCARDRVVIPAGYLPQSNSMVDAQSSVSLNQAPVRHDPTPVGAKSAFELPSALPGSDVTPVPAPQFPKDSTPTQREQAVQDAYPKLTTVSGTNSELTSAPVSLAELQQLAMANNPAIRQAMADADAVLGQVVQAGLHPNPTVGYQGDQIQPSLRIPAGATFNGAGQQGGFINQLIKTAGKLSLAQQVAGYDYINALVAVRKVQVEVSNSVRAHYFAVLVAQESLAINRALADLADEVYRLQLKQVTAGQAAGYEPLQVYAQAVQVRNAVVQAEANAKAAWKQLAAAVGQPDLPLNSVAGRASAPPPQFDWDTIKARVLDQHTDVLTARNSIAQAQRNLVLQRRLPIPDLQTNTYQQYDNAAQTYQFGVQVGIQLPISDRNQGNIRSAQAKIASGAQQLQAVQNSLAGKLAEAQARYEAQRTISTNYSEKVLPTLNQAYRALVKRYQVEPDKVSFNDIVVAQQNLAQALQAYLGALDQQWKAVVDLATTGQLDEIAPEGPVLVK